MKKILVTAVLALMMICSCGSKPIVLEADPGVIIQISRLTFSKSQGKISGYVQIINRSSDFFKVSNQELCLIYKSDTVRAFMKMRGDWEIDKGLVNVMKGKDLTYNAFWPIKECELSEVKAAYIKFISREIESGE